MVPRKVRIHVKVVIDVKALDEDGSPTGLAVIRPGMILESQVDVDLAGGGAPPLERLGTGIAGAIRVVSGQVDGAWITPRIDDCLARLRNALSPALDR
jgi:hypothetical protein